MVKNDHLKQKPFQVHTLCGVEYRALHFDYYPPHVRNLRNYAWKPIIIMVRPAWSLYHMHLILNFILNEFSNAKIMFVA